MRLYHDIASASIMFAEVLHNNNQCSGGTELSTLLLIFQVFLTEKIIFECTLVVI